MLEKLLEQVISTEKNNSFNNDWPHYEGLKIKNSFTEVHSFEMNSLLAILNDDNIIYFAVFEFNYSDDQDTFYTLSLKGRGVEGLRECRHCWFYPDDKGYGYYHNPKIFTEAFKILEKYFDF